MGVNSREYNEESLGEFRTLGLDDVGSKIILTENQPKDITGINVLLNCNSINLLDNGNLGPCDGWKNFFNINGTIGKEISVSEIGQYAYFCGYKHFDAAKLDEIFLLAGSVLGKIDVEKCLAMDKSQLQQFCDSHKFRNDRKVSPEELKRLLEKSRRISWDTIDDVILTGDNDSCVTRALQIINVTKNNDIVLPTIYVAQKAIGGSYFSRSDKAEETAETIERGTKMDVTYRTSRHFKIYKISKKQQ